MKRGSRVGELEREKAGPRSTQMSPYPPSCPHTGRRRRRRRTDEVGGRPSLNLFQAWVHEHGVCVSVLPGV